MHKECMYAACGYFLVGHCTHTLLILRCLEYFQSKFLCKPTWQLVTNLSPQKKFINADTKENLEAQGMCFSHLILTKHLEGGSKKSGQAQIYNFNLIKLIF